MLARISFTRGLIARRFSSDVPTRYLVEYTYVPDILQKRTPFRAEHLQRAQSLIDAKFLIAGGVYSPPTGAMFIANAGSEDEVYKRFVEGDPYVVNGLVTKYTIKQWSVLLGHV